MSEIGITFRDLKPQMPLHAFSNGELPQVWAFCADEIPWCPNLCAKMVMTPLHHDDDLVPEVRAQCPKCRHFMIIADEREG